MRTLAYIQTPIKIGDLIGMLNSEGAWDMELDVDESGVLVVKS